MFLSIYDVLCNNKAILNFINAADGVLIIITFFMIFIGMSNLLTILHQFIYDNNIKENYNAHYLFKRENEELESLRKRVVNTLPKRDYTDYLLYQVIGKKMQELGKPIDTKRYIDEIKSIGIVFISFFIFILMVATHLVKTLKDDIRLIEGSAIYLGAFLMIICLYLLGRELILSKYRSRATRIYTNYLDEVES